MDGCVRVLTLSALDPALVPVGRRRCGPELTCARRLGRRRRQGHHRVERQRRDLRLAGQRHGAVRASRPAAAPSRPRRSATSTATASRTSRSPPGASWVTAYRHNGTQLFSRFIYDTSWSSPALADLDGDGSLEVIVGGDMDIGNAANLPPYNLAPGGLLWVFRKDGSEPAGLPAPSLLAGDLVEPVGRGPERRRPPRHRGRHRGELGRQGPHALRRRPVRQRRCRAGRCRCPRPRWARRPSRISMATAASTWWSSPATAASPTWLATAASGSAGATGASERARPWGSTGSRRSAT